MAEVRPKFFQRAPHPLLRRVVADAQRPADGFKPLVLEKPQQHGLAVLFAQVRQGFVEHGTNALPVGRRCGDGIKFLHSLTFSVVAAMLGAQAFGKGEPAAAINPAHNRFVLMELACQRGCFAGQIHEDTLGHVLGQISGASLS